MKSKITIENASASDATLIIRGILEIDKIERQPEDKKALAREIKQYIKNKCVRVAKENGKTVGFLQYKFARVSPYGFDYGNWPRKFCWIENMDVKKRERKSGIGKMLLKDLEKICRKKGVKEILLDVFEINKNAEKFYDKTGFKSVIRIDSKKVK